MEAMIFLKNNSQTAARQPPDQTAAQKKVLEGLRVCFERFRVYFEGTRAGSIEHELGLSGTSSQDGFGGAQGVF